MADGRWHQHRRAGQRTCGEGDLARGGAPPPSAGDTARDGTESEPLALNSRSAMLLLATSRSRRCSVSSRCGLPSSCGPARRRARRWAQAQARHRLPVRKTGWYDTTSVDGMTIGTSHTAGRHTVLINRGEGSRAQISGLVLSRAQGMRQLRVNLGDCLGKEIKPTET